MGMVSKVFAIVDGGVVANMAEAVEPLAENWIVAPPGCARGWVYADGKLSPPSPDPAETLAREREEMVCSRFQAKAALLQAGLLDQVQAAVNDAEPFVQIAWADAVEFRRNSPTIAALAKSVDMTDEQVDDLFRAAMKIEA